MSEPNAAPHLVRFGVFELDLVTGELRKKGVKVALQEQPFQVLAALVARPGELVTRDELRARLWGESVFVDFERGLTKAIVKIRRALDDLAESPRFVETLERRGYRFVAPVEAVQPASAPTTRSLVLARLVCGDRSIPLAVGEHLLGRDPGCLVWIDSSFVSRRHARLLVEPHRLILEDLGSHNGTLVNGERIAGARGLNDGDEIEIGPERWSVHLAAGAPTVTARR